MGEDKAKPGEYKKLRARAEKDLKKKVKKIQKGSIRPYESGRDLAKKREGDFKKVIHELGVHQIELEMQNEKLRRAQKELEDSRSKYADLYDFAPVGYFIFDKKGTVIGANLTGCRMLGAERASLIKKSFNSFVAKDSQDKFYLHRQGVFKSDKKQSCEIIIIRKDKTTLDVLLESITVADDKGDLTLCRTTITDITELRRAEEALLKSEEQFHLLVESIKDYAIFMLDPKGRVTSWNFGAERIKGYKKAEILGQYFSRFYTPEDAASNKPQRELKIAAAKGKFQEEGWRVQDGSRFWANVLITALRDNSGRLQGYAKVVRDITEHKQAQEQMQHSNEELQAANEELQTSSEELATTNEELSVTNEELLTSNEELRAAHEAVKQSQKTFTELVERAPFGIYIIDSQFRIVHMNISSQNGAFINVRPVIGRPFKEAMHILWPDEVAEGIIAVFRHTLETGEPYYSYDFMNPRHDEKIVEAYEWELHRMILPDGQFGVICYYFDSTKLRQVEQSLRESEERLRLAQEAAKIGSFEWNIQTGVNVWSPELEAMYGLVRGEFGKTQPAWEQLVHPEDRAVAVGLVNQALETGEPVEGEWRVVWRDGSLHWIIGRFQAFKDADGKPPRLIGVNIDITERKLAEEALRESEERLKRSHEIAHLGSWELDLATSRLTWSDEVYWIFGLKPQEFGTTYEAFLDRVHPDDRAALDEAYSGSLRENRDTYEIEHRVIRKDTGEIRIVHEKCEHFRDAAGKIIRSIGMVHDITERKQAENVLQTTMQRFYVVLSSMYASVLLVTDEERVEFANQAFCNHFGLKESPADLVGLSSGDMIEKIKNVYLHSDEAVARIQQIVEQGQPVKGEELTMRNGRTCLRDFIPLNVGGKSYGRLWLHFDITELKRAEETLRKSEEKFSALYSSMTEGVALHEIIFDKSGKAVDYIVTDVNPAYESITGLSRDKVIGKSARDIYGVKQPPFIDVYSEAASSGKPMSFETYFEPMKKQFSISVFSQGTGKFATVFDDITERKKAEEMLRESEERFRAVFESSSDCIVVWDRQYNYLFANQAAIEHVGTTPDKVIGKNIRDGLGHIPDFMKLWMSRIDKAFATGESSRIEDMLPVGDRLVYSESQISPIRNAAGEVFAVSVVYRDVTQRRQAEEELKHLADAVQKERDKLSALVNSITDEIWFADAEKKVTLVNPAVWKEFGSGLGDAKEVEKIAASFEVYRPDGTVRPVEEAPPLRALRGETVTNQEEVVRTPATGKLRHRQVNAAPVRDAGGAIIGSVSVVRDITERKKQEEELRKFNRVLKALNDSSQAMVRASDETDYLREVCRIIDKDCGYAMVWIGYAEDDEAKSVRPVEYAGFEEGYLETLKVSWADTERGRGPTGTAIRTGKLCMCRNMLTDPAFEPWRKEALKRGYASSIVLPLISGGKAFGSLTIYSKEADPFSENEVNLLSELANDLSYGIIALRARAERSRAEEQQKQFAEELKRSNEDLTQFAYVASHDLREPLRAISGFVGLLGARYADKLDDKGREYIKVTADSAVRMDELLTGLLNYSRVQTHGKGFSPIPAGAAFRAAVANLQRSIAETQAVITSDELPTVNVDSSQLTQLFQNLIGNAIKFKGEKEPQIHISCHKKENSWQFSIRDNGIGIDPQFKDRIFVIFQRLHTRDKYPGYGIGLSICKRIVDRHKGRIWVESQPDKGTTFYFTIPV